jgi:L-asparaginase II
MITEGKMNINIEPLAVVTRNDYIESIHYGYICVVDSDGNIIYSLGDPNSKFYFRSSAKPIQVIPTIMSGATEYFNLSQKDIAIACASHSGEKMHQDTVKNILKKLDLDGSALHCGTMLPYNHEEHKNLLEAGKKPDVFHCACSGKHSTMLAYARYKGYDIDTYEELANPVQQDILKVVSEFTEVPPGSIPTGTDGCGLPIYVLPINRIALSYAKLIKWSREPDSYYHDACLKIFNAMNEFPEMVAGTHEFCTELMSVTKGKLIGKVGSEAVYCIGIKESNLGICIKIIDGNERAVYPVVIHLLKELNILDNIEFDKLKHWHQTTLFNNLKEEIGYIKPVFSLLHPGSLDRNPGQKL